MLSATIRALSIVDLVDCILEQAEGKVVVAAAQVNRYWSEQALDRIWKHLPSIFPLLQILAPLQPERVRIYKPSFNRYEENWGLPDPSRIPHEQWQRLAFYDKRVLSITHDDWTPFRNKWSGSVSASTSSIILGKTVNRRKFLPHLRRLSWKVLNFHSLPAIAIALGANVREVDITVTNEGCVLEELFAELRDRTIQLQKLQLRVQPADRQLPGRLQPLLNFLLSESQNLTSISLPQFCLTEPLIQTLGSLPMLQKLDYSDSGTYAAPVVVDGCNFHFDPSTFRALVDVSFNRSLRDALVMLKEAKRENSLTSLTIGTRTCITDNKILREFLDVLVTTNPRLQSIDLNLFEDRTTNIAPLDGSDFLSLQSVKLNAFAISHNHPILITSDDLEWMTKSWPDISTLLLNPDPIIIQPDSPPEGADLTMLSCVATLFPNLRHLGVYTVVPPEFDIFSSESRFSSVQTIDFGTSALYEGVDAVASFVASLIPAIDAEIKSGPSIRHPLPSTDHYKDQWNSVRRLFPKYFKAQSGFQRRLELYRRTNTRLKLEVSQLQETLGRCQALQGPSE